MVENDMRQTVVNWLNRNGYYDAHECLVGGHCDVIGCMWSERQGRRKPDLLEMICVELKMRDMVGVIDQAVGNHFHSNLSYCAMPQSFIRRMRPQSVYKFIRAGVGLLSVEKEQVRVIVYSQYVNKMPHEIYRNRLWNYKLRSDRRILGEQNASSS